MDGYSPNDINFTYNLRNSSTVCRRSVTIKSQCLLKTWRLLLPPQSAHIPVFITAYTSSQLWSGSDLDIG